MASKAAIQQIRREIFGTAPTMQGVRLPYSKISKTLTGPYIARQYPEPIEKFARTAMKYSGVQYYSAQEQRRLDKLDILRRRGKGPPKKGSGKRSKK
mmetsp:Transcript_29656/g.60565  ORF Transcript_29656/g.60565 Transcript_29656/m.60565 type:complete len:97 (+) Transcript_29656:62-352(+)|eukprot:CAMPEP_0183295200 /NCGR_PEP_ID=MMETSP0160_2-20130417/3245_1 /TAXON_ID=2839 ORGANISM="Odontella Sinensis, Strain Grunow 1884" /NCGR_SAMPLE_ID=MMETSP0160_2 /ASSEMBLY_ACC=CAM_ASM_000250 /LENGTH=96 /DNA_ID=CAMNT_0025456643 /DNA_START=63 /DNA_END=353 /DNA_ORIENTATION=-